MHVVTVQDIVPQLNARAEVLLYVATGRKTVQGVERRAHAHDPGVVCCQYDCVSGFLRREGVLSPGAHWSFKEHLQCQ
jgi:hypothetical protein